MVEPIDEEERSIMEAVESGKSKPVPRDEFERIMAAIPSTTKGVMLRLDTEDIGMAKEKAARTGIPYQTLLKSIIHRYFNGGMVLKEPV